MDKHTQCGGNVLTTDGEYEGARYEIRSCDRCLRDDLSFDEVVTITINVRDLRGERLTFQGGE